VLQVIPMGNHCTKLLSGLIGKSLDCFKAGNGGPMAKVAIMVGGKTKKKHYYFMCYLNMYSI